MFESMKKFLPEFPPALSGVLAFAFAGGVLGFTLTSLQHNDLSLEQVASLNKRCTDAGLKSEPRLNKFNYVIGVDCVDANGIRISAKPGSSITIK